MCYEVHSANVVKAEIEDYQIFNSILFDV